MAVDVRGRYHLPVAVVAEVDTKGPSHRPAVVVAEEAGPTGLHQVEVGEAAVVAGGAPGTNR